MKKAYRILLITAVLLGNSYALMSQNDALKILPNGKVGIGIGIATTTSALDLNNTIKELKSN